MSDFEGQGTTEAAAFDGTHGFGGGVSSDPGYGRTDSFSWSDVGGWAAVGGWTALADGSFSRTATRVGPERDETYTEYFTPEPPPPSPYSAPSPPAPPVPAPDLPPTFDIPVEPHPGLYDPYATGVAGVLASLLTVAVPFSGILNAGVGLARSEGFDVQPAEPGDGLGGGAGSGGGGPGGGGDPVEPVYSYTAGPYRQTEISAPVALAPMTSDPSFPFLPISNAGFGPYRAADPGPTPLAGYLDGVSVPGGGGTGSNAAPPASEPENSILGVPVGLLVLAGLAAGVAFG